MRSGGVKEGNGRHSEGGSMVLRRRHEVRECGVDPVLEFVKVILVRGGEVGETVRGNGGDVRIE